jgi:WD40 repeat protein
MNRPYPVAEKVNHLRADVPQLDVYRQQLCELVEAAQVKLELALFVARTTVERVVNGVLEAEQVEVHHDLLHNIETLGGREDKPAKRRGGRPPCLLENIYSLLHGLRIYGNLVAHSTKPGTTQPKDVALRASDLDVALGQLLRVLEWYFEEYDHGPRLKTIYARQPAPEQTALETAVRLEQQYHLRGFVGRQVELQGVQDWIAPGVGVPPSGGLAASRTGAGSEPPKGGTPAVGEYLLLLGPPGQGKSALLAELARREQEPARGGCLLHMIKSESSPLRFVPALLQQAARLAETAFDPETQRGELPQLRNALSAALQTLRERTGRAVLLIDALDELVADDPQRAYDPRIEFLPPILPPGVRVVLTCRPNIPLVQALEGWLAHLTRRDVPPLSAEDFRRLLESRLDDPTLRAVETMLGVDELFARLGGNPLLLSKASERIEELARQASAEKRPLRLTPADLPTTLQAVFRDEYNRIGERAGTRWTSAEGRHKARLLQLLCVAREGLDHRELVGLMAAEGTALPAEDCRDRLAEMSPYLAELGGGRFKPWHQGLTDHVRQEVLGAEGLRQTEEVFCRWMATEQGGRYGLRHRVRHLLAAGQPGEAAQLLTTLPELEAHVEAGLVFELVGDFSAVAAGLPDGKERRRLGLLAEALRWDGPFIHRHRKDYPQALFQCLWNSAWWYDCPEVAEHYELPAQSSAGGLPWQREGLKLSLLLQQWRAEKERVRPGFLWLRSLRPPALPLGAAQKMVLSGHENAVRSVCFSSNGKRIVSGSDDGTVKVWDAQTAEQQLTLKGHTGSVWGVALSADGKRIASGGTDRTVKVWDALTGQEMLALEGHTWSVTSLAFSPDGKRIVSGSEDSAVKVWDVSTSTQGQQAGGQEHLSLRGHHDRVTGVAFSPDGKRIVSCGWDRTVKVWDAQTGKEELCFDGHTRSIESVAFSPDGTRIASGSDDWTVRVWDARTGEEQLRLEGHTHGGNSVAFSPDGKWIASGSWNPQRTVKVWDVSSSTKDRQAGGQEALTLHGHTGAVCSVAFSPDGKRIVSGSADQTVRVWDFRLGQGQFSIKGHIGDVYCVAFSADGKRIASGSGDRWGRDPGGVKVWDTQTGKELLTLKGDHGGFVCSVAFSADGKRLASGGEDRTVKVWDAQTGQQTFTLEGHTGPVLSVAFGPDGKHITSESSDGTARLWDPVSGQDLEVLERGNDLAALASDPASFPWRLRESGLETVVEEVANGRPLAWLPFTPQQLSTHPLGRTWAGGVGSYVCLFTLEGNPPGPAPPAN